MKRKLFAASLALCLMLSGCAGTAVTSETEALTETEAAALEEPEFTENGMEIDLDSAQARREYLQQYRFDDTVNQVLIVTHTEGWDAVASYYVKSDDNDAWNLVFQSDAIIGKYGMNKTQEGDAKTPCGDYAITGAFGILSNPGTELDYIDVTPTTFACDEDCEYYNMIIDSEETGHECTGEEMYLLSPEYNYGLTTSYNEDNTYPNGSAIFIHCKGQKPFTGGCIALDQEDMLTILTSAEPGMRVYMDEYYVQQ